MAKNLITGYDIYSDERGCNNDKYYNRVGVSLARIVESVERIKNNKVINNMYY